MAKTSPLHFKARIDIIGINPFVFVPPQILTAIFAAAQKDKGPVPVRGIINGKPFTQTLVRYSGHWRLYINTVMLRDSPKHVGEEVTIELEYDPQSREVPVHPMLKAALRKNASAARVFKSLPPSRQKEIVRYIASLKSDEAIERNVKRAIDFLNGKCGFVGRPHPK